VRELVAESDRAGMRVGLREEVGGAVPDLVGRTAYRVVQEALTNARKHAPGATVDVHVAGARGQGLTVEVCNEAPGPAGAPTRHSDPPAPGPPVGERSPTASSGPGAVHSPGPAAAADGDPGAGQGLVGLAERVALASGRLEHGPTPAGGWRLAAWLPWPE
jgi:signal transduction histidine kinase